MEEKEIITLYNSKSRYQKGIWFLFKEMFCEIYKNRELIYRLFWRNFVSRYKQSLLSWGWIFFMPFVTMSTFLALNISGVLKIGQLGVPYPIFGLLGVSIWNIFSNGLMNITMSLTLMGDLIGKINFSKSSIIFSTMGQVIIDFCIRLLLILIVFLLYFRLPSYMIFLFPIYLLPLIIFTLGVGFICSILQIIFKDTQHFINLGISFLLFLMPIMYIFPKKGLLYYFNRYNPIYYLISVPRDLIIFGKTDDLIPFLLSSLFSFGVLIIGWFIFYLSETKIAERI